MKNIKELLQKVRAVFDTPPGVANTGADPGNQTDPSAGASPTVYTLQDGTQIAIQQAGNLPAPGDMVTVAGAPAPEGMLTLQDGSAITCDATGKITLYTPVGGTPVTTEVPGAEAAAKPPVAPAVPAKSPVAGVPGKTGYSDQAAAALVAAFDTATGNDLMAVLTTCVKALMQSEFGWQIMEQKRLADTNAAINGYQTTLATLQAATQKFTAQEKVIATQTATIGRHEATIKAMFELLENVVEIPTTDPKTLTGPKKERFDKQKAREDKFGRYAQGLKQLREQAK